PRLGRLNEHDVTECVLGEVRDPDAGTVAIDRDPLVLLRVPQPLRELHSPSLLKTKGPADRRREPPRPRHATRSPGRRRPEGSPTTPLLNEGGGDPLGVPSET